MLQLNKFSTKHDRIEQAFFIVVFVYESSFLEWGASPPNPPGFVALRATTHSARRSLWIALLWQFVQFNICSIVPVILFRCICPVGIWSIKYLFRYPLAQLTFCSIDFCSTDFLFNWFLFNWHFVQLFCSIVLVQFGLGELTCHRVNYISHAFWSTTQHKTRIWQYNT